MKRKLPLIIATLLLVGFAGLAIKGVTSARQDLHRNNIKLESKTTELKKLELDYKKLNSDLEIEAQKKVQDAEKIKQLEVEKQQLEEKYKALEISKANEKASQKKIAGYSMPKVSAEVNCGDNEYKQYIYQKESGCRTTAVNSIGCRGIGQACPGSKLPCGDDFACQDAWFSNYAIQRYGSWEKAYYFWLNNHWW